MTCSAVRDRLLDSDSRVQMPEVSRHLEACPDCAAFAARLDLARKAFRGHRSEHLPDPYFARRVAAAASDSDQLGWVMARLLPVALALAAVLAAWTWLSTPAPSTLVEQAPTTDLLSWALEEDGS